MTAWQGVLSTAANLVAEGAGDDLVVLPVAPASDSYLAPVARLLAASAQHDDDVSALAAIDVLRVLVEHYEVDDRD